MEHKKPFVANAIIRYKDKFLLVKRYPHDSNGGLWSIPGGTHEEGETIGETVRREIEEEVGLKLEDFELLKKYNFKYVIASYYSIELKIKPNVKLNKEELDEVAWFTIDEIKKTKLAFGQNEVFEDYFMLLKN